MDAFSAVETAAGYEGYADKAAFASPSFFGYAWRATLTLTPLYVAVIYLLGVLH